MYGRNIKLTSMFGIALMVFVIAIIPITMFLTSSGSVDIVFNQEAKVSSLQYDVSVLEHQLGSFQCPEVKCKDSPATFVWTIIGLLFYIGGAMFWMWKSKHFRDREEELTKQAEVLAKKKARFEFLYEEYKLNKKALRKKKNKAKK